MTSAVNGRTTKLLRNNTVVAEIYGIGSIDLTADTIDVTNSDSTDGYREFVSGLKTGTFSVSGNLIRGDTGQDGLKDDFENGTVQSFELAFPNEIGTSYEVSATVTDFSEETPHDGVLGFSTSFQVSGVPTFNENTGSAGLTTPFFVITGNISGSITPTPAATGSTYEYRANADSADTSVTITPTAAAGTIYVNGTTVASGVASGSISIGASGSYSNIFIEVKETGKAPKIYLIEIYRQ